MTYTRAPIVLFLRHTLCCPRFSSDQCQYRGVKCSDRWENSRWSLCSHIVQLLCICLNCVAQFCIIQFHKENKWNWTVLKTRNESKLIQNSTEKLFHKCWEFLRYWILIIKFQAKVFLLIFEYIFLHLYSSVIKKRLFLNVVVYVGYIFYTFSSTLFFDSCDF